MDDTSRQPVSLVQATNTTEVHMILEELRTLRREQSNGFESLRAEFNARMDRLVTSDAFLGEQRRVNDRFLQTSKDIEAERELRKEAIHLENVQRVRAFADLERRAERTSSNIRFVVTTLIALALGLAGLAAQVMGG